LSFHFQDSLKLAENIKEMKQLSLSNTLTPLWNFNIPQIISNKIALLLGVLSGVFAPYALPKERVRLIAEKMFATTMNLIHRIFIPIIPIFILGFLLKLEQDNVFGLIMTNHFYVIRNTIIFGIIYILFIYLISSKFNLKKFCNSIYNMLPAAITAFISMSSTAALPYTIEGVEKNTNGGSKIVTSLVPSITNMHLLGDCFLMPACIYIVSKLFNHQITYLEFSLFLAYFALMKFTVITIPGGGILTIMPLLQSQLGFTPEMLSLVTAIYFLLDPFLAFMNVLGNGGFSLILNKLSRNYSAKDGRNHL
jgi:Na+/H+-dicarboxylate symporter